MRSFLKAGDWRRWPHWLFESEIFLSLRISAMASQCRIGTPEFSPYLGLMMFKSIEIIVNHINFQAKALNPYKVPQKVSCDLSWWRVLGLSFRKLRKDLLEKFLQSGYFKLAAAGSLASVPSHTWSTCHTTCWCCRYWVLGIGLSLRCQGKMCSDFEGCRQPESMLSDSKGKATSWDPLKGLRTAKSLTIPQLLASFQNREHALQPTQS